VVAFNDVQTPVLIHLRDDVAAGLSALVIVHGEPAGAVGHGLGWMGHVIKRLELAPMEINAFGRKRPQNW